MGIEPWDVVFSGIAEDVGDGRLARMEVRWRGTPGGGAAEVAVLDRGDEPLAYELRPGTVETFRAYLFAGTPGGGEAIGAVPDPVNVDGRRGLAVEGMAAD